MRAAALAAQHYQRQRQLRDLVDQLHMVQRILIDVDRAPRARVVGANRNDAQRRLNAVEVLLPERHDRRVLCHEALAD